MGSPLGEIAGMTHKQTLALAFGFLFLCLLSAASVYFEHGFLPRFARAMMALSLMVSVLLAIRLASLYE
jgi:hypothetical protein